MLFEKSVQIENHLVLQDIIFILLIAVFDVKKLFNISLCIRNYILV